MHIYKILCRLHALRRLQRVTLQVILKMILSFRHKGLRLYFLTGKTSGIAYAHAAKLRHILARLEICTNPQQMDLPGLKFHALKGRERDYYSLTISGNWRVIFKFDGQNVTDVDYLDYH